MTTVEKLTIIAIYHFKKMRTTAEFDHISYFKKEGNDYVFHALFKGKKRMVYKKLILDKNGNVTKL
jgi:hypothetical protein